MNHWLFLLASIRFCETQYFTHRMDENLHENSKNLHLRGSTLAWKTWWFPHVWGGLERSGKRVDGAGGNIWGPPFVGCVAGPGAAQRFGWHVCGDGGRLALQKGCSIHTGGRICCAVIPIGGWAWVLVAARGCIAARGLSRRIAHARRGATPRRASFAQHVRGRYVCIHLGLTSAC